MQGARHETLRDPLAGGQTLLATAHARHGTEHSKHGNYDARRHHLRCLGNGDSDIRVVSCTGIRYAKVETPERQTQRERERES